MTDDSPASAPSVSSLRGRWRRIAPIAVIALMLILFFAFELQRFFTLDALRDHHDTLQRWATSAPIRALAIFVLVYAAAVAISFPGAAILTIFGGFMFGLWPGVPAVVVGATLGAIIIFLAAKSAFHEMLSRRAGGFITKMERGFREDELSYMFLLRLVPIFPFWAINIAAGVLGVSLRNFTMGTFFGIIPGGFVYASIGAAAGAVFAKGETITLSGVLLQPQTLLPIIGLAVLALLPVLLKRFNKKAAALGDRRQP